jgi:hypothetical protein
MRPFAARGARLATLCGVLLVCASISMLFAATASAAGNICAGHNVGEGVEDPPGSGIWYQCVLKNPNTGQDIIAVARPDWPEVPMALLWPASAVLAFGVFVAVKRRRRPEPVPTV